MNGTTRQARIVGHGDTQLLVQRGQSGEAKGWVVYDLATRECLSGCFQRLPDAMAAARHLADIWGGAA